MVQQVVLGVRGRGRRSLVQRALLCGVCWLGVGAGVSALGCEITVPCPPTEELTIHLPGGTFSPAVAHHSMKTAGAPFFAGSFPRGAADPTLAVSTALSSETPPPYDSSDFPGSAEAIPSAILFVDPGSGVVVRSYLNDAGQLVEERWGFKELQ